jgi:hypothetical protein
MEVQEDVFVHWRVLSPQLHCTLHARYTNLEDQFFANYLRALLANLALFRRSYCMTAVSDRAFFIV